MDGGTGPGADWKVGVDIGGTFIDFCALEARSGQVASLKVLTTPDDPGAELMTGLSLLAEREGLAPEAVTRFVHGTTVGVNTIIQRKGAPLALFTNAGFEDVIELARLRMPEVYSLFCSRPEQLVTRDRVFGIPARLRSDGRETVKPGINLLVSPEEDDPDRGVAKIKLLKAAFEDPEADIPWQQKRRFDDFDYGYALTVHKAQGSQWNNVVLFDESFAFKDTRQRWLYTAITRAAERLTIVR